MFMDHAPFADVYDVVPPQPLPDYIHSEQVLHSLNRPMAGELQ
jgi:hypothetical protein